MRKFLALLIMLSVVVFFSSAIGYNAGITHAVENSLISVCNNEVIIDLDGEIYVHEIY